MIKEEFKRLFAIEKPVLLVTVGADGRPDARAMSAVKVESSCVWMLTGQGSDKYKELAQNPECMLYVTDMTDGEGYLELRLWGRMELLDDQASRAAAWREEYLGYFPGGPGDPNLRVLKFTPDSGLIQTPAGKENLR